MQFLKVDFILGRFILKREMVNTKSPTNSSQCISFRHTFCFTFASALFSFLSFFFSAKSVLLFFRTIKLPKIMLRKKLIFADSVNLNKMVFHSANEVIFEESFFAFCSTVNKFLAIVAYICSIVSPVLSYGHLHFGHKLYVLTYLVDY